MAPTIDPPQHTWGPIESERLEQAGRAIVQELQELRKHAGQAWQGRGKDEWHLRGNNDVEVRFNVQALVRENAARAVLGLPAVMPFRVTTLALHPAGYEGLADGQELIAEAVEQIKRQVLNITDTLQTFCGF